MQISRCRAFLCAALGLLTACAGQRSPPPSTDIDENGLRDGLRILAGDDFEGRRPGTPGEDKTVAYLVERFKKLGLKPVNGESFLQQVPLIEVATAEATLDVVAHGQPHRLAYGSDTVIWTRRESAQSALERSELVFVGFGIVAPEYRWNDYAHVDVHGKTVVVLIGDPGHAGNDPRLFKGNALTYYGTAAYKFSEAAKQGAAGVLLIQDKEADGLEWNTVLNNGRAPQLELPAADGHAALPAVEGWITRDAGRALFSQAAMDFGGLTAAAAQAGFRGSAMGVSVDAQVRSVVRHITSSNVIGMLPGAGRKHEFVMYSAHWDSLGRAPLGAPPGVFAGAVDGASGVAGLLMEAQSFVRTQPAPERSILFAVFTAADAGMLGSAYYLEHPLVPLRQIAGVLSLDALRTGGPTRDVMIVAPGNSELEEYWRQAALLKGRVMIPEPDPLQGWFFRGDQFAFVSSGVPALYARFGVDDSARGPVFGQAQLDAYVAHGYRQLADRYSPDWDVRGMVEDLQLYYDVGSRLARTRRFPRWYPNSEYRSGYADQRVPVDEAN